MKPVDAKEMVEFTDVVLGTLEANLNAQIAEWEPVKIAQGGVKDSASSVISALRGIVTSIQATRKNLPK